MSFIMVMLLVLGHREEGFDSAPIKGDGTRHPITYRSFPKSSCSTDKQHTDRRSFL